MPVMVSEGEKRVLEKLRSIVEGLSRDEYQAFRYVWEYISVGEIIAEQELRLYKGVQKPDLALKKVREKGLIERGEGCYNLASWLRPLRRKYGSNLERLLSMI